MKLKFIRTVASSNNGNVYAITTENLDIGELRQAFNGEYMFEPKQYLGFPLSALKDLEAKIEELNKLNTDKLGE